MITKIVFAVLFGFGLLFLFLYLKDNVFSLTTTVNDGSEVVDFSNINSSVETRGGSTTRLPNTLNTLDGKELSDSPIRSNENSVKLSEEFFEISNNSDLFSVFYDSPTGNVTITLYGTDTAQARVAAEQFILAELPYSRDDWCSTQAIVTTNEFENPRWSGINLGFSFCPGSIAL